MMLQLHNFFFFFGTTKKKFSWKKDKLFALCFLINNTKINFQQHAAQQPTTTSFISHSHAQARLIYTSGKKSLLLSLPNHCKCLSYALPSQSTLTHKPLPLTLNFTSSWAGRRPLWLWAPPSASPRRAVRTSSWCCPPPHTPRPERGSCHQTRPGCSAAMTWSLRSCRPRS